jgi:hypothetical protein
MIPKFGVANKQIAAARVQAAEQLKENEAQRKKAQEDVEAARNRLNELVTVGAVNTGLVTQTDKNKRKKILLYTGLILGAGLILTIGILLIKKKKQLP